MPEIDGMRARLETAGELTGLLTAAWDAFSLLLAACWDCEERAGELFAALAFASAAAAQGRLVIASAAPRPAGPGTEGGDGGCAEAGGVGAVPALTSAGSGLTACALALGGRLSAAPRHAGDPGDRAACQDAA